MVLKGIGTNDLLCEISPMLDTHFISCSEEFYDG